MFKSKAHIKRLEELHQAGVISKEHLASMYKRTREAGVDVNALPDEPVAKLRKNRIGPKHSQKVKKVKVT